MLKYAAAISSAFQTPIYVYDENSLRDQATAALKFPNAYGVNVRFAIKACPNAAILQVRTSMS